MNFKFKKCQRLYYFRLFIEILILLKLNTCIYVYCHVLVTIHGVWTDNWIFWTLITLNYT
jgi:hypothetical protein